MKTPDVTFFSFEFESLGFVSDFVLRISDFTNIVYATGLQNKAHPE
jgi:hypothetical protein